MYATVNELKSERMLGSELMRVEDDRIKRALENASAIIDAKLSNLYSVPFSPVPSIIRELCLDLALCRLTVGHKAISAPDKEALEGLKMVCEDAWGRLKELANGDSRINTVDMNRTTHIDIYSGRVDWWSPTDD